MSITPAKVFFAKRVILSICNTISPQNIVLNEVNIILGNLKWIQNRERIIWPLPVCGDAKVKRDSEKSFGKVHLWKMIERESCINFDFRTILWAQIRFLLEILISARGKINRKSEKLLYEVFFCFQNCSLKGVQYSKKNSYWINFIL